MPIMNLDALHAALPDSVADEAELNRVLRRIGKVPEWDGAMLEAYRTAVYENRLVLRAADGRLVKAKPEQIKKWPTEQERVEAQRVRERAEKFGPTLDGGAGWVGTPRDGSDTTVWAEASGGSTNPVRVQTVALINEVVAERFSALEELVSHLQEAIEAFTPPDVAA
jgi:hypothetical protein